MKKSFILVTVLALLVMLATGCAPAGAPAPTPPAPAPTPLPEEAAPPPAPEPTPVPPPEEIAPPPAPEPTPAPPVGWGIIEVRVTDPPPPRVESANVTLTKMEVHKAGAEDGEWLTIIADNVTFNLFEIIDEADVLGSANVTAGKYTQIRVDVTAVEGTYEAISDNMTTMEPYVAEVPSGKLKFVKPFEVTDNSTTILTLDFDGDKSLIMTGVEGKFLFRPVVKLSVEYEELLAPTVTTNTASNITTTSATLNGSLDDLGSFISVDVSFEWGTETGVYPYETTLEEMTGTDAFSAILTGLSSDTTYYFRAKAEAYGTIAYGSELSFTTSP